MRGRVSRVQAVLVLALSMFPAMPDSSVQATDRPNILWLIAEDMGPELGCYGHPEVWTPAIDELAHEGVRFTRAYTVTPVCSTSRSSFMTGMYAQSIGAHQHRSHRGDGYPLPEGVRLLTDWLRDAGYFTANITEMPVGVDVHGTGKTDWNFHVPGRPFDSASWNDLSAHQPFYAQLNFSETHRGANWNHAHEKIARTADPAKVQIPPYYPDHEITRRDWAQYLNAVMALDAQVGRVIDLLKKQGLWKSTIVVFMADHGRAMVRSKQWPYESGLHIPLIIRWPSDYPAPPEYLPGSVDPQLVCSLDLTAQTLRWSGASLPEKIQGRPFWGPAETPRRDYVFGGRDRGDETVDRIRTVRDERFRYLRNDYPERPFSQTNRYKEASYPVLRLMQRMSAAGVLQGPAARLMEPTRPPEELYDLDTDLHEIRNLADDPEYRETLVRMRTVLDGWIREIGDQGQNPESEEVIRAQETQMKKTYDGRLRQLREAEKDSL